MVGKLATSFKNGTYNNNSNSQHRKPWTSAASTSNSSEVSPLPQQQAHTEYNYSTFKNSATTVSSLEPSKQKVQFSTPTASPSTSLSCMSSSSSMMPGQLVPLFASSSSSSGAPSQNPSRSNNNNNNILRTEDAQCKKAIVYATTGSLTAVMILSAIFTCWLAYVHQRTYPNMAPEWHWDHNVYIPRNYDYTPGANHNNSRGWQPPSGRIALLAQTASTLQLEQLADISSRPNRAYARGWGMDYAQYDSGGKTNNPKACFDKVFVLNTILDRQRRVDSVESIQQPSASSSSSSSSLWPHSPPRVTYDSMILLPPDSIITELDKNLLEFMLPSNKLVAIAGTNVMGKVESKSDILLFNLRHEYANSVAKLWWDLVFPDDVTCGANNDLTILMTAIAITVDQREDQLDDVIHTIEEGYDGFVGEERLIKCIPPSVPGQRSVLFSNNLQESRAELQATADAVCYRFYPKCDVL